MAILRPPTMKPSKIIINGQEYFPRPHEVDPSFLEDYVAWQQTGAPNKDWLSDLDWYDSLGQDQVEQRRIWAIPSEEGQIEAFQKLLADLPDHGLHMLFQACVKGKAHIVRYLLANGVRGTAAEGEDDDLWLVPLHAAAFGGHLDCVRALIEEGKVSPDTRDPENGTALMRACRGGHPDVLRYLLHERHASRSLERGRTSVDPTLWTMQLPAETSTASNHWSTRRQRMEVLIRSQRYHRQRCCLLC